MPLNEDEIEGDGLREILIEAADDDMDWERCPCCEHLEWLRIIAGYKRGACWVIFCAACGGIVEERWTSLP